jgi:hypothetical protein
MNEMECNGCETVPFAANKGMRTGQIKTVAAYHEEIRAFIEGGSEKSHAMVSHRLMPGD